MTPDNQSQTQEQVRKQARPSAPTESSFPRDRLIAESEAFFSQPPYVIAGALSLAKPEKEEFSRTEVVKLVAQFNDIKHDLS